MAEKKEGRKNLAELEGILIKKYVENLKKQMRVREVELTYKVTLTVEEVRGCPFLAGLGTLPLGPEEAMQHRELHDLIEELLNQEKFLSKREKEVLRLYFGLGCQERPTFKEVGERLGITASCASQYLQKAFKKIRRSSKGRQLAAFLK